MSAFLSGWQDCFSHAIPKLHPKAPADRTNGSRPALKQKKPDLLSSFFVGVAGFEPTTSTSQMWRDTGLRYTPKRYHLFCVAQIYGIFYYCQDFIYDYSLISSLIAE